LQTLGGTLGKFIKYMKIVLSVVTTIAFLLIPVDYAQAQLGPCTSSNWETEVTVYEYNDFFEDGYVDIVGTYIYTCTPRGWLGRVGDRYA